MPKEDTQFKKGIKPAGRPPGGFSFRTAIKQHLREHPEDGPGMVLAQVSKAKDGDTVSFKLLMEWIEPALPKTINVSDLTNEQILAALSALEPDAAELG